MRFIGNKEYAKIRNDGIKDGKYTFDDNRK